MLRSGRRRALSLIAGLVPAAAFAQQPARVATVAAKQATRDILIVFATSDSAGLVANLARPEGNLTGVSNIGAAIAGKQLQVIKEMVPRASRAVARLHSELKRMLRADEVIE